jgi:hypothetical protein
MDQSEKINYIYQHSRRARKMRITVYGDGRTVVIIPAGMGQGIAEQFATRMEGWVREKHERFRNIRARLELDDRRAGGGLARSLRKMSRRDYLAHREEARAVVRERMAHFAQVYNFAYNKVYIRNQKSRWGSCSKRGNLSFNYKIIFLPEHLRDYIIVHELCHLCELNHSPRFWALVEKTCPKHQTIRRELRKYF